MSVCYRVLLLRCGTSVCALLGWARWEVRCGGGQGIVIFFLTYIILVVWIFFQVSVAVLLDHVLAARRGLAELMS